MIHRKKNKYFLLFKIYFMNISIFVFLFVATFLNTIQSETPLLSGEAFGNFAAAFYVSFFFCVMATSSLKDT